MVGAFIGIYHINIHADNRDGYFRVYGKGEII